MWEWGTADGAWVDVQALEIGGRASVRVRRYVRRAADRATRAARMPNSGGLTIDAVKEASTKVAPAALEAALIETGARFNLNRTTLVDLDNANVPDTVIDLMVALLYPDKFQVERRAETSAGMFPSPFGADAGLGSYMGFGYPYDSWDPNYYGNYGYYYSPFGYAYSGLYGLPYYYPGSVIVGGVPTRHRKPTRAKGASSTDWGIRGFAPAKRSAPRPVGETRASPRHRGAAAAR